MDKQLSLINALRRQVDPYGDLDLSDSEVLKITEGTSFRALIEVGLAFDALKAAVWEEVPRWVKRTITLAKGGKGCHNQKQR